MSILVLKTNIGSKAAIKAVQNVLNYHPVIARWSIDTEDVDNILRIETSGNLSEGEVSDLMKSTGYVCEELPD